MLTLTTPTRIDGDANQVEPKPSPVEAKLKANLEAMAAGQGPQVVVALTKLEDLTLRSTYLQAKLLEQQYLTARSEHMIAFDRRADVADTLRKVEAANEEFNKALDEMYDEHNILKADYVYDMDRKALVPISGVSETPVVLAKEPYDEEKVEGDITAGKKEDKPDGA